MAWLTKIKETYEFKLMCIAARARWSRQIFTFYFFLELHHHCPRIFLLNTVSDHELKIGIDCHHPPVTTVLIKKQKQSAELQNGIKKFYENPTNPRQPYNQDHQILHWPQQLRQSNLTGTRKYDIQLKSQKHVTFYPVGETG